MIPIGKSHDREVLLVYRKVRSSVVGVRGLDLLVKCIDILVLRKASAPCGPHFLQLYNYYILFLLIVALMLLLYVMLISSLRMASSPLESYWLRSYGAVHPRHLRPNLRPLKHVKQHLTT